VVRNPNQMLQNFLKVALRQLQKNKIFSMINIAGLSIGLTCFTIIALHVENEYGYDRFHQHPEDLYRVVTELGNADGTVIPDALTPPALSAALRDELPEVEQTTRLSPQMGRLFLLEHKEKRFYETNLIRVDAYFFDVFNFAFAQGDKTTALSDIHSIVLTETTARKYFGTDNPLGQTIRINLNNGTDYTVTAVLQDIPSQSHFQFDILIPFESQRNPDTDWNRYGFYTYVRLKHGSDPKRFEESVVGIFKKHQPLSPNKIFTQRVTDIHLKSNLKWEMSANSDIVRVRMMMLIAFFIILLAGMNYINLATAQSSRRAREVGVRKVTGAHRHALVFQFLAESLIVVTFSLASSIVITELILPFTSSIFGNELTYTLKASKYIWIILSLSALVIAFGAGLYPAFYMSSFKPVLALRGNILQTSGGVQLRKALVIFQFVISTVLIVGSLTIARQLDFMNTKDKGYNASNVMILPNVRNGIGKTIVNNDAMLNEMSKIPGVERITRADGIIGTTNSVNGLSVSGQNHTVVNFIRADYEYIPTLQMQIIAGRNFSEEFRSDSLGIILNEKAIEQLGLSVNSIGQPITWDDDQGTHDVTLIGIVKDFHFRSLREEIKPFGFILEVGNGSNFFLRISAEEQERTIAEIGKVWAKHGSERPFDYIFEDESLAQFHQGESRFKNLVEAFTFVAICIACLGLFGLISHLAENRAKEIGIRKVLGATVRQLVQLMSVDFVKLICIALIVAIPVSWFVMTLWLETFAYRISFDFGIALTAGVLVLAAALITIAYQVIYTSLNNPIESLRDE
jgi:putative ABC transport system permease protein